MSQAKKCDRCHNYYDPYFSAKRIVDSDKNGQAMDLCPVCQEKLKKWLKEYEFFDNVCEAAEQ